MMNYVCPVVTVLKNVLSWVNKNFDSVSNLQLNSNQSYVHFVVDYHHHVFVLQAIEFVAQQRHSVNLVLSSRQVIHLPPMTSLLVFLKELFHFNFLFVFSFRL